MKKILIILPSILFLSSCTGISSKDKNDMQSVLKNELLDRYQMANFPISFMQVEITKLKKEAYTGTLGKYSGYFKCNFTENNLLFSHA